MASEVEKLKEKLAAEKHSNQKAAEYGLKLLEQIKSLQNSLEIQKTEHEKAEEKFKQLIHTLSGKLDVAQQVLKDQTVELEMSKESCANLKSKIMSHESEHQRQLTAIEKTRNQLELECLEKDNCISALKKNIEELEIQVNNTSKLHGTFSDTTDSFEQNLQLENQELQTKNRELENKVFEMEKQLIVAKNTVVEMQCTINQMQEDIAFRDNKLEDCQFQKGEAQEELDLLRSELETFKFGQLDIKKRGNSLFAEVEDNRKALEKELKMLRSQVKVLKEKDETNQEEIKQMTHQIACLLNMNSQRVDTNYVLKLTQDLSQARGEIEELSLKLKSEREKQNLCTNIPSPVENVPKYKGEGYAFMNTLIEERDRKIEKLVSELQSVNLMKTSLSNRSIQTDKQLYIAEKKNDSLKAEIVKLKQVLHDLKENTTSSTHRNTPELRVEKIPGFREKQNTDVSTCKGKLSLDPNNSCPKDKSQTVLLPDNKENRCMTNVDVVDLQLNKDVKTPKEVIKDCTKKVSFAVTDTKEDSDGKPKEQKCKPIGKKAEVPFVFVSSSDASSPSECKQQ